MNTMVKALGGGNIRTRRQGGLQVVRSNLVIGLFVLGLLLSAFSVVYFKDLNRRLFIQYQDLQQTRQQYEVEWGKLLLEQSTWSTQARIQQIAQQQFGMIIPRQQDVVMVEE